MTTTTVIFDGDCGFCTWSVRWLERLDRHRRLRPLAYQLPGVPERHGLTVEQCAEAAWTIGPDGHRHRGAGAISAALGAALATDLPLRVYELPLSRPVQDRLYDWISENRGRLPKVTPWCKANPGCRAEVRAHPGASAERP